MACKERNDTDPCILLDYADGANMKNYILTTLCITTLLVIIGMITEISGSKNQAKAADVPNTMAKALFAGGCFWCMEKPFELLDGVISAISGYTGGTTKNPTYEDYGAGGHIEVVQIIYDPHRISYEQLLETFWRQIDPTDAGGQFVDRGHSYISAIFYYNDSQKKLAEEAKQHLQDSGTFAKPIVTAIEAATEFWPAENYHQDYYRNNSRHYNLYRSGSGRDAFLERHWKSREVTTGKEDKTKELGSKLTPLQE